MAWQEIYERNAKPNLTSGKKIKNLKKIKYVQGVAKQTPDVELPHWRQIQGLIYRQGIS